MEKYIFNKKINELVFLLQNNQILKAEKIVDEFLGLKINNPRLLNLIGLVKLRSGKFNESLEQFSKGLEINQNNFEICNNKGLVLYNLGKINEAINFYKKSAEIKDDYYLAYYNLGNAYIGKADFKNAILNFDQTLKIKEDFVEARNNIIQSLTYYNSSNLNSVIYSKINNDLQNLKFNYEKSKNINVKDIKKYFENCMEIVNKSIPHLEYKFSQIYRRDQVDLNCSRHFSIFNKFNVIPDYCFSCYKIQIETQNVLDLIKLYLVFDNLEVKKSKLRKCFVETRPNIPGSYKALIYFSNIKDLEEAKEQIEPIIKKNVNENSIILIKRGCSEFSNKYPSYGKITPKDQMMSYPVKWKEKEDLVDEKLPKTYFSDEKVLPKTLNGQTLNDILIIGNWICYARIIGDYSYKGIIDEFNESIYISKKIKDQKNFRIKEFKKKFN